MEDNKILWLDFNDAPDNEATSTRHKINADKHRINTEELKNKLLASIDETLFYLFPNGKIRNNKFYIGDVHGNSGKSLNVDLKGNTIGFWYDFNTGEGGDIFDLWAIVHNINIKTNFKQVVNSISNWLHEPHYKIQPKEKHTNNYLTEEYYPPTNRWDYRDSNKRLIACVYRYDTPNGKKEFRPWDVIKKVAKTPTPRPLYNQHIIKNCETVVLVEGEKSADALTNIDIPATTAMNGSNAPVDKTDWSPLYGKNIIIWPDNDKTGYKYAEKVYNKLNTNKTASVKIISIPSGKPESWDAYDAIEENIDIQSLINENYEYLPVFNIETAINDKSPMPEDLISDRILTPGGILVLGGAPKVGKSDFLLSFLIHMTAGEAFLGFTPPRPLKIFCLQTEIQYDYLRERIQLMNLPSSVVCKQKNNFIITKQLRLILDNDGIVKVIKTIEKKFKKSPPDIIVIDPIRNVFDGGDNNAGENDNNAMLFFLRDRVEKLRDIVNPKAGIILTHHTKKIGKKQVEEDPFMALSGAGSLRSYYTSGILLYKPDDNLSEIQLIFELRNGKSPRPKRIDKINGEWVEVKCENERLINNNYGKVLDSERQRKNDAILDIIHSEASNGRVYTINQFAESFEGRAGLGAHRTIIDRLSVLASKGYIKFFRDAGKYNLPQKTRSQFGYLCVQDMYLSITEEIDKNTGKIMRKTTSIKPTHYKCPHSGAALPVEDQETWIIHDKMEL